RTPHGSGVGIGAPARAARAAAPPPAAASSATRANARRSCCRGRAAGAPRTRRQARRAARVPRRRPPPERRAPPRAPPPGWLPRQRHRTYVRIVRAPPDGLQAVRPRCSPIPSKSAPLSVCTLLLVAAFVMTILRSSSRELRDADGGSRSRFGARARGGAAPPLEPPLPGERARRRR